MDQSEIRISSTPLLTQMPLQKTYQVQTGGNSRLDRKPRFLIDNQDVSVLIHNLQRNPLFNKMGDSFLSPVTLTYPQAYLILNILIKYRA
jgi:hypothetical protein